MKKILLLIAILASPAFAADTPATTDAAVKAFMQKMNDRAEIHDLIITYGRLLDAKDLAGYSKLFAADGVWEGGIGSAKGPKEIQGMLERVYSRPEPGQFGNSYHIMSDFLIEPNGDTATAWSRWTWVIESEKGNPEISRSGHYEDRLVRENGKWRFKHRLTVTEMPMPNKDENARIFRRDHREGK